MSDKIDFDEKDIKKEFKEVMDINKFLYTMNYFLEKYSDEKYLKYIKTSVPDCKKYYGVPVPILRALVRETGGYIDKNPQIADVLLPKLWEQGSREEMKISAESLAYVFEIDESKALELLMEFLPGINNWEICDTLASIGFKPYILKYPDLTVNMVNSWIKSPNPWLRRFGIVSLIPLAHSKDIDNLDLFFVILKKIMKDDSETVQKGAAWLLREITQKDPHRVAKFLEIFARSEEPASRRIIREGSKKLEDFVRTSIMETI